MSLYRLVWLAALVACTEAPPPPGESTAPLIGQDAYLKASNTAGDDLYGSAIAVSADGGTLAVAAAFEDSAATGIDGDQASDGARDAGAVYVYTRTGMTWTQQAYVKASNTTGDDDFGWTVALSSDGDTLAVGAIGECSAATGIDGDQADDSACGSGAVYVFARSGTTWTQQAYVKASNTDRVDWFGRAIALSGDGDTLAVGAEQEDSAAAGIDGDQDDDSLFGAGAVYVFARTGATWAQQAYVKASNPGFDDRFGNSVALTSDGSRLAVGAVRERSAATGIDGNQADNSAPSAGAVYLFARTGAVWAQEAYVKASNSEAGDSFGIGVALAGDGATLAVGAYLESSAATGVNGDQASNGQMWSGAVYVFARAGATWAQEAYIKASNTDNNDTFGMTVSLSSDGATLAVSGHQEASGATGLDGDQLDNAKHNAGAAYLFERTDGRVHAPWRQRHYVKASNTGAGDEFATSLALSGDATTLVVGAPGEASAATGVGGNQADNTLPGAGAAYVFR